MPRKMINACGKCFVSVASLREKDWDFFRPLFYIKTCVFLVI